MGGEVFFDFGAQDFEAFGDWQFLGAGLFAQAALGALVQVVIFEVYAPVPFQVFHRQLCIADERVEIVSTHKFFYRNTLRAFVAAVSAGSTKLIEGLGQLVADFFNCSRCNWFVAIDGAYGLVELWDAAKADNGNGDTRVVEQETKGGFDDGFIAACFCEFKSPGVVWYKTAAERVHHCDSESEVCGSGEASLTVCKVHNRVAQQDSLKGIVAEHFGDICAGHVG